MISDSQMVRECPLGVDVWKKPAHFSAPPRDSDSPFTRIKKKKITDVKCLDNPSYLNISLGISEENYYGLLYSRFSAFAGSLNFLFY